MGISIIIVSIKLLKVNLETLQQKGRQWQGAECGWRIYYALFSRSGFTQPLLDCATTNPKILVFDPTLVISAEAWLLLTASPCCNCVQ